MELHGHQILQWFKDQNWFVLIPAFVGYLNVVVAGARVLGWTQLAEFCGKLEDCLQAMFNAAVTRKAQPSILPPSEPEKKL